MTYNEKKVLNSTVSLIVVQIIVKIIGYIKQSVIAAYYGTGLEIDAYLLVYDFISEIGIVLFSSLSITFLNSYIRIAQNGSNEKKGEMVSSVLFVFVPISIIISFFLYLFADPLSYILAPGFSKQGLVHVVENIRVLSIAISSSCCANIFTAILEAEKDFIPGKTIGIIQSICVIIGCIFFSETLGVKSLIYSYLLFCLIENIYLLKHTLKYIHYGLFSTNYLSEIRLIIKQSIPLFISNAVTQVNAVIDKAISSGLGVGNISALSYAQFIFSSIHSIIIGSSCSVLFSHFSSLIAEKDYISLHKLLRDSINVLALILVPIMALLCLDSNLIVRILFGHGKFEEESICLTQRALMAYSFGLLFIAIRDVFIRLNYAFQNTKTPMRNGVISVLVNIVLSLLLFSRLGGFGIALASSVSQFVGMFLILVSTRDYIANYNDIFERKDWISICIAGFVAFLILIGFKKILLIKNEYLCFVIDGTVLIGSYFALLVCFKCKYILQIIKAIRKI